MADAGIFAGNDHIELINGQLIETVARINPPHTYSTRQLVAAFFARFASRGRSTSKCRSRCRRIPSRSRTLRSRGPIPRITRTGELKFRARRTAR